MYGNNLGLARLPNVNALANQPNDWVVRRLTGRLHLSASSERALRSAADEYVRDLEPRRDIGLEGERRLKIVVMGTGWGCRYKLLIDGRRQILDFIIPGDFCSLDEDMSHRADHSIGAITAARVARIDFQRMRDLASEFPELALGFRWNSLTLLSRQREWMISLGQRTALERIAHLLCELYARLKAVGMAENGRMELPLTQTDLADAAGLTSVHVNRTLQELRRMGAIVISRRVVQIVDIGALHQLAMFDPAYLHLKKANSVAHSERAKSGNWLDGQ